MARGRFGGFRTGGMSPVVWSSDSSAFYTTRRDSRGVKELFLVERKLAGSGRRQVPSEVIGRYVLEELRNVDEVAYIRFASVYRSFQSVSEFFDLLQDMGAEEEPE